MIDQIGQDIWMADGPTLRVAGFAYPTRAVIIRLADMTTLVWSPVALSRQLKAQIDGLGQVPHLIAPNSLHHMSLSDWQGTYPDAQLHGAPGLAQKRPELRFDTTLGNDPDPAWQDVMDQHVLRNRITTEIVCHHKPSRTTIFTDILQQFPPGFHTGWRGVIARLDLMTGMKPNVPRKFRLGFTDRRSTRDSLRDILHWPTENLIMAHGSPVMGDGQAALRQAFDWLMK